MSYYSDYANWTARIYNAILDISDLEFQRRAWLTRGNEVSSFTEVISTLYDDSFFTDFLKDEVWDKTGLSDDIRKGMRELMRELDLYCNTDKEDSEILVDPEWHRIAKQAKSIVSMMEGRAV